MNRQSAAQTRHRAAARRLGRRANIIISLLCAALLAGCANPQPAEEPSPAPSGAAAHSSPLAPSSAVPAAPSLVPPAGEEPSGSGGLPPLHVAGTGLAGPNGSPVLLRGVSTHGLAWYPGYVNEAFFRELREEWNANVVRLALYTAESGGYCTDGDRAALRRLLREGVRCAGAQGLYAIVDWHILSDGDPNRYLAEAKEFFAEFSAECAGDCHVLYEICNEPNGGVGWDAVKAYALEVIPVIRANDPDAMILVGTPTWSQDVDQAAADPITEYDNLLYTLHFYAATHTDALRDRLSAALDAGLPVFVSEFGICDASGSGAIDRGQAGAWMDLLNARGVGCVAWNLSNKQETSAMFRASCEKTSGFAWDDLSESGQWVYAMLTGAPKAADSFSGVRAPEEATPSSVTGTPEEAAPSSQTGAPERETSFLSGDGLKVSIALQNEWEADGLSVRQYAATITNVSQTACGRWTVALTFSQPVALLDGWNGAYTVQENTLVIASMDYNGALAPGESAGDVGFIISGEGEPCARTEDG